MDIRDKIDRGKSMSGDNLGAVSIRRSLNTKLPIKSSSRQIHMENNQDLLATRCGERVNLGDLCDYSVVLSPALDFSPQPAVVDRPLLSEREVEIMDVKPVVVNGSVVVVDEDDDEVEISSLISPQTMNSPATRYLYSPTEKPLISSRFSHRKPVKNQSRRWEWKGIEGFVCWIDVGRRFGRQWIDEGGLSKEI
ncbi:hypothetical protein LguiB_002624 [Lonicera macranthoides]